MIVNQIEDGWEIVMQQAHAMLAVDLYRFLEELPEPALDTATLLAVGHHDDLQVQFETGDYVTDLGAPKDFTLLSFSAAQRSAQVEAVLAESYRKNKWTGMLISYHYDFLYNEQEIDNRLRKILETERARRRKLLYAEDYRVSDLDDLYGLVRWCDRCSLILCRQEVPSMGRQLEINDGLGESTFIRRNPEDDSLGITPWPFSVAEVEVGTEVFTLNKIRFDNGAQLADELAKTAPEYRTWTFKQND